VFFLPPRKTAGCILSIRPTQLQYVVVSFSAFLRGWSSVAWISAEQPSTGRRDWNYGERRQTVAGRRDRDRGNGAVVVGRPRRRVGHRRHAEDRVRRPDATSRDVHGGKLGADAVPVPAAGERDGRGARRTGPPDAHLAQRVRAVQRVHGPGPGRAPWTGDRHVPAGLLGRQPDPPHDHLSQRRPAIRTSGLIFGFFVRSVLAFAPPNRNASAPEQGFFRETRSFRLIAVPCESRTSYKTVLSMA